MIAGLLLAAGRSTRFGGDKLLAPLRGRPVIRWSAEGLARAVDMMCVVVPTDAPELTEVLAGLDVAIVENAERDRGLSSSIAVGMAALPAEVEAVVIALADQPLLNPAVVRAVCGAWRAAATEVLAVVPRYRDGRGHPVLFARTAFPSLRHLRGDRGARDLLDSMCSRLLVVNVDDLAPRDVDTPDMLSKVEGSAAGRGER
jgi:Uncharacterized MobA-related protein